MLNNRMMFCMAFSLFSLIQFNEAFSKPTLKLAEEDTVYMRIGYSAMSVGNNIFDAATDANSSNANTNIPYKPNYKTNFLGGSVGVGKIFGNTFGAEVEGVMQSKLVVDTSNEIDTFFAGAGTTSTFINKGFRYRGIFLNSIINFSLVEDNFSPYFGGGVGFTRMEFLSDPTTSSIDYPFAFQLKAGLSYVKTHNIIPYMGYRYTYLIQTNWDKPILPKTTATTVNPANFVIRAEYSLHNFDAGLYISGK